MTWDKKAYLCYWPVDIIRFYGKIRPIYFQYPVPLFLKCHTGDFKKKETDVTYTPAPFRKGE